MRARTIFAIVLFSSIFIWVPYKACAENYGVFFGTSQYKYDNDLPACEDDARDMYNACSESGMVKSTNGKYMAGSNRKILMKKIIMDMAAKTKPGDTLFIYNSSHGSGSGKILTSDGYISSKEMSGWLAEAKCSNIVFINDSCHSGGFTLDVPGKNVVQLNSSNAKRVSCISSVETAGTGHKNSVFTKYFIEGLKDTEADMDKDGSVSSLEALQYTNKKMFVDEHLALQDLESKNNPYYQKTEEELIATRDNAYDKWNEMNNKVPPHLRTQEYEDAMDALSNEYWSSVYAYEIKTGAEKARWQSPTLNGQIDFVFFKAPQPQAPPGEAPPPVEPVPPEPPAVQPPETPAEPPAPVPAQEPIVPEPAPLSVSDPLLAELTALSNQPPPETPVVEPVGPLETTSLEPAQAAGTDIMDKISSRRQSRQQRLQGKTPVIPESGITIPAVVIPEPPPEPPEPQETQYWSTGDLMQEGSDRYLSALEQKMIQMRLARGERIAESQAYQAQLAQEQQMQMQQAAAIMQQAIGMFKTFNAANQAYHDQHHAPGVSTHYIPPTQTPAVIQPSDRVPIVDCITWGFNIANYSGGTNLENATKYTYVFTVTVNGKKYNKTVVTNHFLNKQERNSYIMNFLRYDLQKGDWVDRNRNLFQ